jgi:plastocyanin
MNGVGRPKWPLLAVLGIVAGWVAIWSPSPAPAADAGARVQMVDNEPDLTNWHFDPAEITVPVGSTVVWSNQGKEEHTVTADNGSFDSGYKKPGTTFQRAFPTPGRFAYHCAPHPWMKGTVVVAAGAPAPTRAAADAGSSTTTAPASATPTTLPSSLAAPTTAPGDTATSADKDGSDQENSAAPAASRKRSGGHLASTIAIVVLPTLGGLAIGSRLRRSKS